ATADRAGLVLCGELPAAFAALPREAVPRASDGQPAPAPLDARSRPDVLALLSFAATEEHFALRQKLRVAIA
ncbi:MAG TPA: hypothetical protein VF841_16835, partial [Anaeromyxobacter sp.]